MIDSKTSHTTDVSDIGLYLFGSEELPFFNKISARWWRNDFNSKGGIPSGTDEELTLGADNIQTMSERLK